MAKRLARATIVLLTVLDLSSDREGVAVIGAFADTMRALDGPPGQSG